MKKKLLSIMLSLAVVLTMVPAMGSIANAADQGSNVISLALDYDQLTTFNASHTGAEVSAEIKEKIEVQSQYYHSVESTNLCYYESGTEAFKPVGSTSLNRNTQYYLSIAVGYKDYPAAARVMRFNGRTLSAATSKPVSGQFLKYQRCTVGGVDCDIFYIPVDVLVKYCGPDPYLENDTFTYTGSAVANSVINYNPNIQYIDDSSVLEATAVGKYKVTVKLMDKSAYCFNDGTITDKTYEWTIKPAAASVKSLTAGTKSLKVTATTKPSSKGGSYYQIGYKMKGSSTWKYTTTSASYKTIKSLTKGKYYYVKIRAYKTVNGTKYYGAWSSSKLSGKIK